MKRSALVKHLEKNGCHLLREGANHTIYINPFNPKANRRWLAQELDNLLCKRICKQLEIQLP